MTITSSAAGTSRTAGRTWLISASSGTSANVRYVASCRISPYGGATETHSRHGAVQEGDHLAAGDHRFGTERGRRAAGGDPRGRQPVDVVLVGGTAVVGEEVARCRWQLERADQEARHLLAGDGVRGTEAPVAAGRGDTGLEG